MLLLDACALLAPWLHNVEANPLEELAGGSLQRRGHVRRWSRSSPAASARSCSARSCSTASSSTSAAPWVGVVVLSVAFGLGHFVQGWDAVITTGVLGAFWAVVYLRRRSSVAPIVSHAGFNSLEACVAVLVGRAELA